MQQGSQASGNGDLIILGVIFLIIGIVFIMPSIVAFRRNHPNRWIILVINVAFGGTIIGWGVAMVWALRAVHQPDFASSGGESGLNLFINDVKKIQVIDPPPLAQAYVTQELECLHDLLLRGAISQIEFEGLKDKVLGSAP
jgi:hypothetical protein